MTTKTMDKKKKKVAKPKNKAIKSVGEYFTRYLTIQDVNNKTCPCPYCGGSGIYCEPKESE